MSKELIMGDWYFDEYKNDVYKLKEKNCMGDYILRDRWGRGIIRPDINYLVEKKEMMRFENEKAALNFAKLMDKLEEKISDLHSIIDDCIVIKERLKIDIFTEKSLNELIDRKTAELKDCLLKLKEKGDVHE